MAVEFLTTSDMELQPYGSEPFVSFPWFTTSVQHQAGLVMYGSAGAGNNLSESVTVSNQSTPAIERGTWFFETATGGAGGDFDEIQDNYVKNPMLDTLNFSNIWVYVSEATPGGQYTGLANNGSEQGLNIANAGLDTWISMGATNRAWIYARSTNNTQANYYALALDVYCEESGSQPSLAPTNPSSNATYIGRWKFFMGALA